MSDRNTLGLVTDILHRVCDIDQSIEITMKTRFIEDLALDSMGMLALSAELENQLERVLSYNFENPPLSVGDLVNLVDLQIEEVVNEDSL